MKSFWLSALSLTVMLSLFPQHPSPARASEPAPGTGGQTEIPYMNDWPQIPDPFQIRDWKQTADDFYRLAFDPAAAGPSLPLIRMFDVDAPTGGGFSGETFAMPSYLNAWNKGNYASSYNVQVSDDGSHWREVYSTAAGKGGTEDISLEDVSGRYVRVNALAAPSSVRQFEMIELQAIGGDGTNLALHRTAAASSSGSANPADLATDGNLAAGWKSASAADEWLSVDLGAVRDLRSVKLMWASPYGEGVNALAAVLGAGLMGRDMTDDGGNNWVAMIENYYSRANGRGFVSNGPSASDSTESFWYDLYPTLLFDHIASLYPEQASINAKVADVADSWLEALDVLNDNWNHTGFSFKTMKTTDTGAWTENDAVIGIAYLEYMAYLKTGDDKYVSAAENCLAQASRFDYNPLYEIVGSYGPYIAARMNAEQGQNYPVNKFLDWVFSAGSDKRPGWGTENARWGDYDAYGLLGSTEDSSGYAFAMNTFVTAGAIAPTARYAPQYSAAIGRYLLQVASNANLFFPDGLPADMQRNPQWSEETGYRFVAYEGVRNKGTTQPYGTGDWPEYYGVYSTAPVGMLASIVERTNVPEILKIDLLKTDFSHEQAYPTYLYYNPLDEAATVDIDAGGSAVDLYDAVTHRFVARNVTGATGFTLQAGQAVQLVLAPAGGEMAESGNQIRIDGVTVAYNTASVSAGGLKNGDSVSGMLPLDLHVLLPETDGINRLTIEFGGKTVYSGEELPSQFRLDTSVAPNGKQLLTLSLESRNGLKATSSTVLSVANIRGETVLSAGADDMALWTTDHTAVQASGGNAVLTVNAGDTWGTLASGSFALDMDSIPIVTIDAKAATGNWGAKLVVGDTSQEYYIQGDTAAVGVRSYELPEALKAYAPDVDLTGVHTVRLVLFAAGGAGSSASFGSVRIQYGRADAALSATAADVASWISAPLMAGRAELADDGESATVTENNGGWGAVASPYFPLDLDRDPVLTMNVRNAGNNWFLKLHTDRPDDSYGYYVKGDTTVTGEMTIHLTDALKLYDPGFQLSGVQNMQLLLGASGGTGASVTVGGVKIVYQRAAAPLGQVTLTADKTHAEVGDTVHFSVAAEAADHSPADLSGADIMYTSSSPDILSVDDRGAATAFREGTASVTAAVTLGGATATSNAVAVSVGGVAAALYAAPADIAAWTPLNPVSAELVDGGAAVRLTEHNGGWGAVNSPFFTLDFDQDPVLTAKINDVNGKWFLKLRTDAPDDRDGHYLRGDNTETGEISFPIADALKAFDPTAVLSGVRSVQLQLGSSGGTEASGGAEASVTVAELRVDYPPRQPEDREPPATTDDAPGAPVLRLAGSGDGKVLLRWNPVDGSDGYHVYRSEVSGSFDAAPATVARSVYHDEADALTNGKTYYFVVKAFSAAGEGPASNEVAAVLFTVPAAPTMVAATAGDGRATVTFDAPADNGGSPISSYVVIASPGNIAASGDASPITVSGLSNGTAYTFRVKAVNGAGSGAWSAKSGSVVPEAPPSTPTPTPTPKPTPTPSPTPSHTPTPPDTAGNGAGEAGGSSDGDVGAATTSEVSGRKVTTVVVDRQKLADRLAAEGRGAVIAIAADGGADAVIGQLDGQMIKELADRQAVLEIRTAQAIYTIPAGLIHFDAFKGGSGR